MADPDALPKATCSRCGLPLPHSDCVALLRDLNARLQFKLEAVKREKSSPSETSPPQAPEGPIRWHNYCHDGLPRFIGGWPGREGGEGDGRGKDP